MTNRKELLREFLLMNLGTCWCRWGLLFQISQPFFHGRRVRPGGAAGKAAAPALPSTFNTIINVLFLVLGFVMLNRGFGAGRSTVPFSPPGSFSSLSGRFPWTVLSPTSSCWSCSSR